MTATIATACGMTTKWIGSIDIMRSPSSCSVATIVPISAVVAEPARPVASSAVSTGPSSRRRPEPDDRAERARRAEADERVVALEPEHHPDREAADADDDERQHAELVELVDEARGRASGGTTTARGEAAR